MSNLGHNTQAVNNECDSVFCPGIGYDPFAAPSDDPFENTANGSVNKLWCYGSERNLFEPFDNVTALKPRPLATGNAVADSVVLQFPIGAARLRLAVRAAIAAYEASGKMLDAALAYAAHDIPIFPLDPVKKTPIPGRDRDPVTKQLIPGSGGVYKATTDLITIKRWWRRQPHALIGLPMGERTGVWCLDVDTAEGHAQESVTGWTALAAQHEPIITREHRSATGGPHILFNWYPELGIGGSKGDLPAGISVKGSSGSYIAVAPSRRKGRSYTVFRDIDPIDAPQWLIDLILQGRTPRQWSGPRSHETVDLEELSEMVSFIPNIADTDYDEYKAMALRIHASIDDEEDGFAVFQAWSQRWPLYDPMLGPSDDRQCWEQVCGSPPSRTGVFALRKLASERGWVPKLETTTPTYQIEGIELETARQQFRAWVRQFLREHVSPDRKIDPDNPWPAERAAQIDTASGKTRIAIEEIALFLREEKPDGPIIYTVPQHSLSKEVLERFQEQGVNARIFYGHSYIDPEKYDPNLLEKDQLLMCLRNDKHLKLAMQSHADITKTCCKTKKSKCPLINKCGYFRQQQDAETVEVWIIAADMLFLGQKTLKKAICVFIDEGVWRKGVPDEDTDWAIPLNTLLDPNTGDVDHDGFRRSLGHALSQQKHNGAVVAKHLKDVSYPDEVRKARNFEWNLVNKLVKKLGQKPHMSDAEIDKLLQMTDIIDDIQIARRMIVLWDEVSTLMWRDDIKVSGRLKLKRKNGQRELKWQGVNKIMPQFRKPTMLLDATLPDLSILKVHHSQIEVMGRISVKMPEHVRIQQVIDVPSTSLKLDNKDHCAEMYRYIMQQYIEFGCQETLVICQMKLETYLEKRELTVFSRDEKGHLVGRGNIHVEHFNNLRGLDRYKDVRLEIMIGGTAPGPRAMESLAGALSGAQPLLVPETIRFDWYPQVDRGIGLKNGLGIKVKGDQHPDPFGEPIRFQVYEGEQMQAIGRARGLLRTAGAPLEMKLLTNNCLPILVDSVINWGMVKPSLLIETAIDGAMLTSPIDMMKLWPKLWPNHSAAERTIELGVPKLPGFVPVPYHLAGPKMKRRLGHFHLAAIPDPKTWLAERLGPLAAEISSPQNP